MTKQQGLEKLAEAEGFSTVEDMLQEACCDSVVPGICLECGHEASMEPDQDQGYCEGCGKQTVQSCLIMAGLI